MQTNDWLERWRNNHIGFHEATVNVYLQQFIEAFKLAPGDTVFMPLCGKAHDINWLAQQGLQVIGIELSEIAIEAFFSEHNLQYQIFQSDRFTMRKSANICIFQGNFYDLVAEDLNNCDLVYDRASLIAIDPASQPDYCQHLLSIIPDKTPMLLIGLDYDQTIMQGPPFAVSSDDVNQYYSAAGYDIELLAQEDVIDEIPRWREQGLSRLIESVYRLSSRVT